MWLLCAVLFTGCGLISSSVEEGSGQVQAFDLKVGFCFDAPGVAELDQVTLVKCGLAHDFEIFHTFQLGEGPYPGPESLEDQWIQGCLARFEGFVGSKFDESTLDISAIFPTLQSWDELKDREVLCSVTAVDGSRRIGSAQGSGA